MAELAVHIYPFPGLILLACYVMASGWVPAMTLAESDERKQDVIRRTSARLRFGLLLVAEVVFLRVVWSLLAVQEVQASLAEHTQAETRAVFDLRDHWTVIGHRITLFLAAVFLILTVRGFFQRDRSLLWIDVPALVYLSLWMLNLWLYTMMSSSV